MCVSLTVPTIPLLSLLGDSGFAQDPSEAAGLPGGGPVGVRHGPLAMLVGLQGTSIATWEKELLERGRVSPV